MQLTNLGTYLICQQQWLSMPTEHSIHQCNVKEKINLTAWMKERGVVVFDPIIVVCQEALLVSFSLNIVTSHLTDFLLP